jgi:hypothetical protein
MSAVSAVELTTATPDLPGRRRPRHAGECRRPGTPAAELSQVREGRRLIGLANGRMHECAGEPSAAVLAPEPRLVGVVEAG